MFTTYMIVGLVLILAFLIFGNNFLPNWCCDYLGHTRPKNPGAPKHDGTVLIGKCSRCGKLVQNDTDYPNDVWY